MAEAEIYIDCDSSRVVTSRTDNTVKALPRFVQGDTISLRIHLLKGFSRASNYEEIPTDGLTIQVALRAGLQSGSGSLGSILASQYSWDPFDDLYFQADFGLNTDAIATALTSAKSADATFEVKYLRSGVPTTCLQAATKVWKAMIDPTSVMPVATPTPLSAEAAQATYVRRVDEDRPIYLMNATSGVRCKIWIDTGGTFHADPET